MSGDYNEPVPDVPDLGAYLVQQCNNLHAELHEAIENRQEEQK